MTKTEACARDYLSKLKSSSGDPDSRTSLLESETELVRAVHEMIAERRLDDLQTCVSALCEARTWLERRQLDPGGDPPAMTPAELGNRLGLVATLEALLRLNPAYDVTGTLRKIALDGVKMNILHLVRHKPRTKTEISQKVPRAGVRANRTPASITSHTRALVRAGLTYETSFGAHRFVHLSNQGERLLALVERKVIPGAAEFASKPIHASKNDPQPKGETDLSAFFALIDEKVRKAWEAPV